MSFTTAITRVSANGDGVSVNFIVPWLFYANTDLLVILSGATQALGVQYNVTGAGLGSGTVSFVIAPPVGVGNVQIILNDPLTQLAKFVDGTAFPSDTLNQVNDRAVQIASRLSDLITRSLHAPDGDASPSMILPPAAARANTGLVFDANGDASLGFIPTTTMTQTLFDAYLDAAPEFQNVFNPLVQGIAGPGLTPAQGFENLGGISMTAETTLTASIAMTVANLGQSYLIADSGSPAPYTITLPAAAPVGSIIQFRVYKGATQLYTLAGNDVGIDGDATRVLWRNETCLLVREAANWSKIGGRTVPFRGCLQRSASQSIASGTTFVAVGMNQENGDTYGLNLCLDTGNTRFKSPRHTSFSFVGNLVIQATVSVANATCGAGLGLNTSTITSVPPSLVEEPYLIGQPLQQLACAGVFAMAQNDFLNLTGRIYNGTIATPLYLVSGGVYAPTLSYAEIPLW